MKTLLIISHTPSPNTQRLLNSLIDGAHAEPLEEVEIKSLSAFETQSKDIISADAVILCTPENLGYMSGALKDVFDRCYYDCIDVKQGLPVAAFIRAGHDGTGTVHALQTITTGLKWRWVQEPLVLKGNYNSQFENECFELGAAMACALESGII